MDSNCSIYFNSRDVNGTVNKSLITVVGSDGKDCELLDFVAALVAAAMVRVLILGLSDDGGDDIIDCVIEEAEEEESREDCSNIFEKGRVINACMTVAVNSIDNFFVSSF